MLRCSVGACPESVRSILNSPGTLPESPSLLDRAGLAAGPEFCLVPLETGSLVSNVVYVTLKIHKGRQVFAYFRDGLFDVQQLIFHLGVDRLTGSDH